MIWNDFQIAAFEVEAVPTARRCRRFAATVLGSHITNHGTLGEGDLVEKLWKEFHLKGTRTEVKLGDVKRLCKKAL